MALWAKLQSVADKCGIEAQVALVGEFKSAWVGSFRSNSGFGVVMDVHPSRLFCSGLPQRG